MLCDKKDFRYRCFRLQKHRIIPKKKLRMDNVGEVSNKSMNEYKLFSHFITDPSKKK